MRTPEQIDAVVFDMGGVFVVPSPARIGGILAEVGIVADVTGEMAHEAHYRGIRGITELIEGTVVDERDLGTWAHYDMAYFSVVGLAGEELERAIEARDRVRRHEEAQDMWTHRLVHNIDAFARIAAVRPVAVVTNNNGTAVQQCIDHGICQLDEGPLPKVAAIVDSTVVQISKPDPRIFDPAIDALSTDRARTLYVGDTVHADVHGADAAGLPVVQLDPYDLHDDHDHWRLPDVVALADLLTA